VRTFGTMTADLLALVDWLGGAECEAVAMESTGSFWKPLYNLLEGVLPAVMVVNAAQLKQVPGRKTDVKDAEGIADLLRHGLLHASFIPARAQRELRELTRSRTSLVRERAAEVNRGQKVLEGAHSKLSSVATDLTGVAARELLAALLAGSTHVAALAQCARGRLREKIPQLALALVGSFGPHPRLLVAAQLAHIDYLDAQVARVSAEVAARVRPFAQEAALLDTATGIGRLSAAAVIAEVGRPGAGQQRERGQAQAEPDPQRQPLAARHPGRGRPRRRAHSPHLPWRPLPSLGRPPRQEARCRGGGPQAAGYPLPSLAHPSTLPGARGGLSRPSRQASPRTACRAPAGILRLCRLAAAKRAGGLIAYCFHLRPPWHRRRGAAPAHEKPLAPLHSSWLARMQKDGIPWCHEPVPQTVLSGRRHPRLLPPRGAHVG
jgi:transposase